MKNREFSSALMSMFGEASRVMYELRNGIRPEQVTQVQYNILEYIYFHENGATVSAMSGCLYMSMPNVSREVRKLVEAGYLDKSYSNIDKRTHQVVLTKDGKALMDKAFAEVFKRGDERYAHLSDREITALTQQLKAITEKLFF